METESLSPRSKLPKEQTKGNEYRTKEEKYKDGEKINTTRKMKLNQTRE